jgi:hypothetical protein
MGMFGGGMRTAGGGAASGNRLSRIGAMLQDVAGGISGGPVGYTRQYEADLAAQQKEQEQKAAVQALLDQMRPRQASPMGPGIDGAPMGNSAKTPGLTGLLPALTQAQASGVDVRPYAQLLEMAEPPKEQVFNTGNGYIGVVKPGQNPQFFGAPDVDQRSQYLQAQEAAQRALAGARQNQGGYYAAKAKQPYAPPRSGGGGSKAGKPWLNY